MIRCPFVAPASPQVRVPRSAGDRLLGVGPVNARVADGVLSDDAGALPHARRVTCMQGAGTRD
ncbi:MAG TPA: hypothetical protein VMR06_15430 [Dokdonella sp.]|uniref:hypothetical protein n=1 Tax=Dokdonella sp. TaxID=2291710 RepID=UPI002B63680F|nr:hypothetical protein [Dokdonella sp.]HUD43384.1 hypothetical protein [Dokdonella sp.]